jgi:hypothetical protein
VSNVKHRKCAGSKTASADHEASEFLKQKGITKQLFGHSYIADFPNWRAEGVTHGKEMAEESEDRGSDGEVEEGEEEMGGAWGTGWPEGQEEEEREARGDMRETGAPSEETMLTEEEELQKQIEVASETWLDIQEMAQSMIKSGLPGNPKLGGGNVREMTGDEKGEAKRERGNRGGRGGHRRARRAGTGDEPDRR